jgi:hypothetical protein
MTKAFEEFLAKKAKAKVRKEKRAARARELWTKPTGSLIELKKKIVHQLGLRDKRLNGDSCRIHRKKCSGPYCGYHLVPQARGGMARLDPRGVVYACTAANRGEQMNRSLYREKHVEIFGEALILELEALTKIEDTRARPELEEMLARLVEENKSLT